MAYEANNRHADCIALYKQLEMHHPSVSIRRQASELRYILQAPKLKITQEEMVTIPLIGSTYDRYIWFFFFCFVGAREMDHVRLEVTFESFSRNERDKNELVTLYLFMKNFTLMKGCNFRNKSTLCKGHLHSVEK